MKQDTLLQHKEVIITYEETLELHMIIENCWSHFDTLESQSFY